MCGMFSDNSSFYALRQSIFAKRGYLRMQGLWPLADGARPCAGNRLFTIVRDCVGKARRNEL
jgi:hypothetical protein